MWLIWKENGEIIEWYPWFVMNIFESVKLYLNVCKIYNIYIKWPNG
jgi:hypothetical protein